MFRSAPLAEQRTRRLVPGSMGGHHDAGLWAQVVPEERLSEHLARSGYRSLFSNTRQSLSPAKSFSKVISVIEISVFLFIVFFLSAIARTK